MGGVTRAVPFVRSRNVYPPKRGLRLTRRVGSDREAHWHCRVCDENSFHQKRGLAFTPASWEVISQPLERPARWDVFICLGASAVDHLTV